MGIRTTIPGYKLQVGTTCTVTGTNSCVDFVELIPSSETVDHGDVVMVDPNASVTVKKAIPGGVVLGVVTTDPAIVIEGSSVGVMGGGYKLNPMKPAIALAGRVPVKVSEENGPIKPGDRLTVSKTLPGCAMKMTESGQSIGIALEPLTKADKKAMGKILVFVNLGYQHIDIGSPDTQELAKENESLIARNKEFEERLRALEDLEKRK